MAKIRTSIIIRHTQNPRFTRPENHNDRIFAYPSLNSHQKSLLINTRARFRSILMPVLLLDPHPSLPADYYDSLSHWNWYRKERQKKKIVPSGTQTCTSVFPPVTHRSPTAHLKKSFSGAAPLHISLSPVALCPSSRTLSGFMQMPSSESWLSASVPFWLQR